MFSDTTDARTDGIQAGANTIIIPVGLVPAAEPGPAGDASLQPAFLLRPTRPVGWLAYTLMSCTGAVLLCIRLPADTGTVRPVSPEE